MSNTETKTIVERFFEEEDRIGSEAVEHFCDPNYTGYIAGHTVNREESAHMCSMFYHGFPDLKHVIEETIVKDNKVAVRFRFTGTHTGDFMGIAPTNKAIDVRAIGVYDIAANEKIIEEQVQFDQMGMMQQLGVILA
jgi:steroid delta-isomerase-like uncharacterized protein